jgi:protoporphyrinogen oxidase
MEPMKGPIRSMGMINRILILGGGPAGLAAGYYAAKKGLEFSIFEAEDRVGGMCKTWSFGDYNFDLGAHRFHDQDDGVTLEIKELLGDSLSQIDIHSQIYSDGRFIDFPLSPFNLIRNIGPFTSMKSGIHWLRSRLSRGPKDFKGDAKDFNDFERFAIYKYGKPIAERFLLNYSEKLWGLPSSRLSLDISGKRLKGLCLTTFIMAAFSSAKVKTEHLDGIFYYPKRGFGEIVEGVAAAVGMGRCLTNKRVTRILHHNRRLRAIELNGNETIKTDRVISTLPLPHFLEMLEPKCPEEISALAKGLSYRKLILVMLFLNLESVTRCGTVYFPASEFPFNRISEPRNRSPWMAPPGKTSLLAEIPCGQDEPLSESDKKKWIQIVCEKLVQIGWIRESDVMDARVEHLNYAYPVLDIDHGEKLERIMEYLGSFQNLKLIGRNSLFKYIHFHDMMRSGREAVDGLAASGTE